jgi:DNA-binding transcriptional ArsR family regulator
MWKRFGNSVLSANDSKYVKVINLVTEQLLEFKKIIRSKSESEQRKPDRETQKLLFYLFTSTRGGLTRLRIIMMLLENPLNTHQLSKDLNLDYKAVQHHMKVLEKNNMISKIGEKYGAVFHLSNFLEINIGALDTAIDKLDRKLNHKKVYL